MIENNLYTLMSNSEIDQFKNSGNYDFVINLEALDGCIHSCEGCFVNRRNRYSNIELDKLYNIAKALTDKGLRFRELIISPTDIFSANNSTELLSNPLFQKLLTLHPKTRITTTAMFENTSIESIKKVFDILDSDGYKKDMILELLIPMNIKKVLEKDSQYLNEHKALINFLSKETPKIVDWSFVINVHDHDLIYDHYDKITKIVKEDFGGIIEFLPSFFRTGHTDLIISHLELWKTFLQSIINKDNYKDIMLTIADLNHNAMNTLVLNYKNENMYISPFIYEQIIFNHESLKIDNTEGVDSIFNKHNQLITDQYDYINQTSECKDCSYLSTCIGRNVLSFMEAKDIKDCIYPKEILSLYTNTNPLSERIKRCK